MKTQTYTISLHPHKKGPDVPLHVLECVAATVIKASKRDDPKHTITPVYEWEISPDEAVPGWDCARGTCYIKTDKFGDTNDRSGLKDFFDIGRGISCSITISTA
jgi:hypothetical protein